MSTYITLYRHHKSSRIRYMEQALMYCVWNKLCLIHSSSSLFSFWLLKALLTTVRTTYNSRAFKFPFQSPQISPFPLAKTPSALTLVSFVPSSLESRPTNPFSRIPLSSSSREMQRSVCSCVARWALTSFTNKTVAAPARKPAVISSIESLDIQKHVSAAFQNWKCHRLHQVWEERKRVRITQPWSDDYHRQFHLL